MFKKLIAEYKHRQVIRKLRKLQKVLDIMVRRALVDHPDVILRHVTPSVWMPEEDRQPWHADADLKRNNASHRLDAMRYGCFNGGHYMDYNRPLCEDRALLKVACGRRVLDSMNQTPEPNAPSFVRRPNPVPNCRIRFTVQEPGENMRKLTFSIVAGNPVTVCLVKGAFEENLYAGFSVCKHGDSYDLRAGVRKAFENAIQHVELTKIERVLVAEKFGKEIAKL